MSAVCDITAGLIFNTGMNETSGATTFPARRCVFVRRLLVLLLAAQVAGVDRHRGFDLLLRQFHALVKHFEELLGLVVAR